MIIINEESYINKQSTIYLLAYLSIYNNKIIIGNKDDINYYLDLGNHVIECYNYSFLKSSIKNKKLNSITDSELAYNVCPKNSNYSQKEIIEFHKMIKSNDKNTALLGYSLMRKANPKLIEKTLNSLIPIIILDISNKVSSAFGDKSWIEDIINESFDREQHI